MFFVVNTNITNLFSPHIALAWNRTRNLHRRRQIFYQVSCDLTNELKKWPLVIFLNKLIVHYAVSDFSHHLLSSLTATIIMFYLIQFLVSYVSIGMSTTPLPAY